MMSGQAIEVTFLAWICAPQAALGCVAGRDGGRGLARAGNRGPAGGHESYHMWAEICPGPLDCLCKLVSTVGRSGSRRILTITERLSVAAGNML
jgi:hypothetical protein